MLIIAGLIFSAVIFAQTEVPAQKISWTETSHDFGTIKEEGGAVSYKFEFTNTGTEPLFLTNVKASCGCTATEYSKEPVAAGAKGYVTATYNPMNRPGRFDKSITVTTNEAQPTTVLKISGEVTPKPVEVAPVQN